MKFWDREKEIRDLKRYLQSEPNAILFVYGPKSSGKSNLLMKIAQELRKEPLRFLWYDLRGYAIEKVEDAISIILGAKGVPSTLAKLMDIQIFALSIKTEELLKVFKREKDPFVLFEEELVKLVEKEYRPVIVFDEIQNLRDIYLNGDRRLIDRLFNFFVRITKVQHLSHVLVMTSDTFFIEEVYSSSALKNTSEYYLVDYFDDDTAFEILVGEGLPEEDARYTVEWIGGVPWMMERVLSNGNVKEKVKELYKDHRTRLREFLGRMYEEGGKDLQERVKAVLRKMVEGRGVDVEGEDRGVVKRLVGAEVLFYDPLEGDVKFQTKLDERAVRELIG